MSCKSFAFWVLQPAAMESLLIGKLEHYLYLFSYRHRCLSPPPHVCMFLFSLPRTPVPHKFKFDLLCIGQRYHEADGSSWYRLPPEFQLSPTSPLLYCPLPPLLLIGSNSSFFTCPLLTSLCPQETACLLP